MRITSQAQLPVETLELPDDGFEELRAVFCERLKGERLRLLDLSATLAHGNSDRGMVLIELRNRAHRLSGTAAIFELRGVAALARALELAVEGVAEGTATLPAENSDRVMHAALRALTSVISSLGEASRALQAQQRIQAPRRTRAMLNG